MFRTSLIAVAVSALAAGCATPTGLTNKKATVQDRAEIAIQALPGKSLPVTPGTVGTSTAADALASKNVPVARRATKAWHGARMADVQDDSVLPPIFSENFKLDFDDRATRGRVSLAIVAERLSRISGVPVRIKADVFQSSRGPAVTQPVGPINGAPLPANMALPAGMPAMSISGTKTVASETILPVSDVREYQQPETSIESVEMRWDGRLSAFLDHLTGRLNLSWAYRDGTVVLERFITESFELTAFGGSQDYKMALTGGNSGSGTSGGSAGSATSTLDLTEAGKMTSLESLKASIEATVRGSGGSVVLNEGTGRFFVTATKDVMGRVRDLIKSEDASLQRQAQVQFDIYSVVSNDADEAGVDWSAVYKELAGTWGAAIKSPTTLTGSSAASMGVSIFSTGTTNASSRFGDSSAVLALLNQVGNSALYRPVSMIAMNRQWARKTNLKVDGYVSETTPSTASSAGSGAPGLKTASITTGDKFMVQPAILDNGSILLKFGVSLTELLGLFDVTAGSGDTLQKVQTPVTSGTDDQGTIRLQPGEAMVVTGLSRRLASSDRRTLGDGVPIALGGSRKDEFKREDFLIVVRASQL